MKMNKVAMVTGSSRGMGKAEVYEFASTGYDVIVHYVNSREAAENISKDIKEKYGVRAAVIKADLTKENEVRELAARALQEFEQSMQVNLYAPFLLTQILGVEMAKNKYGKTRRSSKTGSVSCK